MDLGSQLLPDSTAVERVDLLVRDLNRVTHFYEVGVGLERVAESGLSVTLGSGGIPLLELTERRDLPAFSARDAGLFHTAFLYDSQADLAAALGRTAQIRSGRYAGSADHLVSEAFYFSDPEGNGVELYVDRPRSEWDFTPGGDVRMASLPLDPNRFLDEHLPSLNAAQLSPEVKIGHIHLQVGDIPVAKAFYESALGMPVTAQMGNSALFLAAGGYHHHIGLNTWNSGGAGPRAASLGLASAALAVGNDSDLIVLQDRLTSAGVQVRRRSDADRAGMELVFTDPWGTVISVAAAS